MRQLEPLAPEHSGQLLTILLFARRLLVCPGTNRQHPAPGGIRSPQELREAAACGIVHHRLAESNTCCSGLLIRGFGVQVPGGAPALTWRCCLPITSAARLWLQLWLQFARIRPRAGSCLLTLLTEELTRAEPGSGHMARFRSSQGMYGCAARDLNPEPAVKSALFRVRLLPDNARRCHFVRNSAHFAAACCRPLPNGNATSEQTWSKHGCGDCPDRWVRCVITASGHRARWVPAWRGGSG